MFNKIKVKIKKKINQLRKTQVQEVKLITHAVKSQHRKGITKIVLLLDNSEKEIRNLNLQLELI